MAVTERASGPVIIAGAGPTGLTLATELRRGGAEVVLLERRPHRGVDGSRAAGMQPRTIELLDQRGVAERFLAVGPQSNLGNFAGILLDYSVLPSRFPYAINILQAETEQILEDIADELGVCVCWSSEVTGARDTGGGVAVTVEGPGGTETITGSYLVGCDGGRSVVRQLIDVGFSGTDSTMMCLIGDVELDDPPPWPMFLQRRERGSITAVQFRPGWYRICTSERKVEDGPTGPVTLEELKASTLRVAGTDFGMHDPTWLSRFGDAVRQADRYRVERVLLAGDAAHIHLPAGGQGMNMGIQDAFNLGWKLAMVLRGEAPESLLDTYHSERHAADAEMLKVIRAQSVIVEPGRRADDLFDMVKHLVGFPDANDYLAAVQSGLGIRYAIPGDHQLLGRRVPDADINSATGATRIYELLNAARPVVLDFSSTSDLGAAANDWAGLVDVIKAQSTADTWAVPGLGMIPVPAAVLIRPDGYVGWVDNGDHDPDGLRESLTTWCGPGVPA
ncbi:FAD-dependent monooxygenase [[Mycobacterium] nativiensis]|uniref:FAD-dependent monooxygenase n=1 Tax=[Mycobacterium] nativiensis TaxID=2855503 RepID=A0ABU5XRP3_9MYCO|nr:FAD-dependent monooxygenase [Mycolicibacter sp. MYC340]MEB3030645.1 FAD-dependent monooxygenase [Mycolicibacter sp. MYC340]